MTTVKAYASPSSSEDLISTTIERREVGAHDVLIEIRFAGICHSDIHTVRGDWGPQQYPLVPGHEIAGVVTEVGSAVTKHQVGDRVGVGCMVNSCRECANCLNGDEQYCLNGMVGTYGAEDRDGTITQGGYSTHVVVSEHFVVGIPDGLGSTSPHRCCVPGSPRSPRCAVGALAPARRLPLSASAGWATWPSRSPPPWVRK